MWATMAASLVSAVLIPALTKLVPMWIEKFIRGDADKQRLTDSFNNFISQYNAAKTASADGRNIFQEEVNSLKQGVNNGPDSGEKKL